MSSEQSGTGAVPPRAWRFARRRAATAASSGWASSDTATGVRTSSATSTASTPARWSPSATRVPNALARARKTYPGVQMTTDFDDILKSPDIDAVAVITPVWTHYDLAKKALENGKHVFVEKPFTSNSAQAQELIELAARKQPADHGRPHVPVQRRGAKDSRGHRRRHARPALLLRFDAREPRAVPARRERRVGPGAARFVDHGPRDRRSVRRRWSRLAPST